MIYSREFVRAAMEAYQAVQKLLDVADQDSSYTVVSFGGVNIQIEQVGAPTFMKNPTISISVTDKAIAYAYGDDEPVT